MLQAILIMAALAGLFYILYIHGYLIINSKRALLFFGKNRGKYARFASCSGFMKRVIRFKESGEYQFVFETELEKGEVSIELWNNNQEKVLLMTNQGNQIITVQSKKRDYLILRFESATANYNRDWNKVSH